MPRQKAETLTLDEPLNDEELDRLDEILLARVGDDTDVEGKDEGIVNVSELDGFLTAVVSGPAMIMPSQWLPLLWGDFEPTWNSIDNYQEFMSLAMRHLNSIALPLTYEPEAFEPMFFERRVKRKTVLVVDDWCEGYMRGVSLAGERWLAADKEIETLLLPIVAFSSASRWAAHELDDPAETDALRNAITPNVRALHAYWLARRTADAPATEPVVRTRGRARKTAAPDAPRVQRNDPCPCGSGKKYKKCCLQ